MIDFARTWWSKTSTRARKGWKYLGIGVALLIALNIIQMISVGIAIVVGFLAVALTVVGVALIIWGSTDLDDLRSYKS